jgi:hypothetical protein
MTTDQLTALLVERIMGWRPTRDKFIMANRQWLNRWRFQPTSDPRHALRLLEETGAEDFTISGRQSRDYRVAVRIHGALGEASENSIPLAICVAVARALGMELERVERG